MNITNFYSVLALILYFWLKWCMKKKHGMPGKG